MANAEHPEDRLGRPLRALRVSVTDRCNFRCGYCMPPEVFPKDHPFLDRSEVLRFEEILRLARVFMGLGVRKIRLTGGEPLLRKDLPELVHQLAGLEGLEDLALTTNGALLPELAAPLKAAGLKRLTVSLDTLNPERFRSLCNTEVPLSRVLEGLAVARQAGFVGTKLNCVVERGVNEDEAEDLAAFARAEGLELRFIEFMDVGTTNGWRLDRVVPGSEVRARIHARWPLEAVEEPKAGRVAESWRYRDGRGRIGFITSVTQPFCGGCDRARLSADGRLYTCLFTGDGLDLKAFLRGGHSDASLAALLGRTWTAREDRYSELRSEATPGMKKIEMSRMGG
ncbi:MAG TPA: GTP 3',8-cyclase MoaA [Holophagaceae bacterium]|nr:GTP 3',8-cyclase MoaA [Holophagaceae bacterium]